MMKKTSIAVCIALSIFFFAAAAQATELPNPLGINCGSDNRVCIQTLLTNVSRAAIGLIAIVATFMFILGGFLILTAGGSSNKVDMGKKVLQYATIGIVVIMFSASLLQFIFGTVGAKKDILENVNSTAQDVGLQNTDVTNLTTNLMLIALGLLGIVAVAMMIISGYLWITAGGNDERVRKARAIMFSAVIGLVVVLLSWAIIQYVIGASSQVSGAPADTTATQCQAGYELCRDQSCALIGECIYDL